jgi:type I restriction-modification system DNA methylase subunit
MKSDEAAKLLADTLPRPFTADRFTQLAANLVKDLDTGKRGSVQSGIYVYEPFRDHIHSFQRLGQYTDPDGQVIDVLAVEVKDGRKLDRARTALRNFGVEYLKRKDEYDRESLLLAYYAKGEPTWRLSYLHVGFEVIEEKGKVKTKQVKSPARRLSYLVGEGEPSHTAATQLRELLRRSERPTLAELEKGFAIEKVSEDFFQQYKTLFANLLDHLNAQLKKDKALKTEFDSKGIEPVGFAKKLLGQLVFLYFLQKKGWLGVPKTADWGAGDRNFLRSRWQLAKTGKESFFDDHLKYLFYEALADPRKKQADPSYYKRFDCRIPFLNGGLFEPERGYDWQNVALKLPNTLFSNADKLGDDTGTGILDVFDRFNFTVKEDEPLEREVAVDPEMLGKVFERLLEVKDRKSKGAFYTPREIVHYLCQQSLALYLDGQLNGTDVVPTAALGTKQPQLFSHQQTQTRGQLPLEATAPAGALVALPDLETFLRHSTMYVHGQRTTVPDAVEVPAAVRQHAADLDKHLADIRVLDPAIGSGAFPVGMLHEIVQARLALAPYLPAEKQASHTPYKLKRACIQKSIYGVDIDASAIEISKLRLWLSLVVDEDDVRQIEPLPNLEYNIVAGNSLNLPSKQFSFNDEFDLQELEKLHNEAFDETNPTEKNKLRAKIDKITQRMTRGEFDFGVHFGEVMRHGRKGFDVVIGNPPYGGEKIDDEQKKAYGLASRDVYGAFLARFLGMQHASPLVKGGLLTFIISDTFMTIKSHLPLREQLLQQQLLKLVRVHADTFDATVNTVMILARRQPAPEQHHVLMGDLTNVSARLRHRRFLELLGRTEGLQTSALHESSAEYALYRYPQRLINTCSNHPFFVASPNLFALMADSSSMQSAASLGGVRRGHEVRFNGNTIRLLKFGDHYKRSNNQKNWLNIGFAQIVSGIKTGGNKNYVRKIAGSRKKSLESIAKSEILDNTLAEKISVVEKNNGIISGKRWVFFEMGESADIKSGYLPKYYTGESIFAILWSKDAVSEMRAEKSSDLANQEYRFIGLDKLYQVLIAFARGLGQFRQRTPA